MWRVRTPDSFKGGWMGESSDDALSIWIQRASLAELIDAAERLRDEGHGRLISYSRKVFVPLTHLCRDVCHYCTFAERPGAGRSAYLSPDDVLVIARAGAARDRAAAARQSRSHEPAPDHRTADGVG